MYDDYKFVTREQLEQLQLTSLLGTNTLRPYMHGTYTCTCIGVHARYVYVHMDRRACTVYVHMHKRACTARIQHVCCRLPPCVL